MPDTPRPNTRTRNLGLTGITALTGCVSLVVILAALFIGLSIDGMIGRRGPATVCALVISMPISLFLMTFIALRLVRQITPSVPTGKTTGRKPIYEEKED